MREYVRQVLAKCSDAVCQKTLSTCSILSGLYPDICFRGEYGTLRGEGDRVAGG